MDELESSIDGMRRGGYNKYTKDNGYEVNGQINGSRYNVGSKEKQIPL